MARLILTGATGVRIDANSNPIVNATNVISAFEPNTAYAAGDHVVYSTTGDSSDNKLYVAISAFTSGTAFVEADWEEAGSASGLTHISTRNLTDWPLAGTGVIRQIGTEVFDGTAIQDGGAFRGALLNGPGVELELNGDFSTSLPLNSRVGGNIGGTVADVPEWIGHVTRSEYFSGSDSTIINITLEQEFNIGGVDVDSIGYWRANVDILAGVVGRPRTLAQRQALFSNLFVIEVTLDVDGFVFEDSNKNLSLIQATGTGNVVRESELTSQIGTRASQADLTTLDGIADKYVDHDIDLVNATGVVNVIDTNTPTGTTVLVGGLKTGHSWENGDYGYLVARHNDASNETVAVIANFIVSDMDSALAGDIEVDIVDVVLSDGIAHDLWSIYPGTVTAGGTGLQDIPNTNAGTHYIRSRVTDAMTAETVSEWTAVDLDTLENRNDITVSRDEITLSELVSDGTITLDVSLDADPFTLRYALSPQFTVDPSRWEIYDGEYIRFTYYTLAPVSQTDPTQVQTVIPTTYFVGQIVGFQRNTTNAPETPRAGLGTTDIPAEHIRLEIQNLAVSQALQNLIAEGNPIDSWFITPANSLDALNIERGALGDIVDYTWLGTISGEVGHLGYSENSQQLVLQRDPITGRQDWVPVQEVVNRPHYDVSANLPLQLSSLRAGDLGVDGYEITYTLPVDVDNVQIDFRGEPQSLYNNPDFPIEAGTHTVAFEFVAGSQFQTLIRGGGSVYTDDARGFRLAIRIGGDTSHYNAHLQSQASTQATNNFVTSGTVDGTTLTLNRRGLDSIQITGLPSGGGEQPHPVTNVTSNIPVDNTTIVETPATPYEIGYTLGETIQSGHVELYGNNVGALTDLEAGDHTFTITLTTSQVANIIRAGTQTYVSPNFQLVARLAGDTVDTRYSVRFTGDAITGNDIYVDGALPISGGFELHRHGESVIDVSLEAANISNFNTAVLNIIEHQVEVDWTYTADGADFHDIATSFLFLWEQGIILQGLDPEPTTGDVLRHGATVRFINEQSGAESNDVYIWEGVDITYGTYVGGTNSRQFVLQTTHDVPNYAEVTRTPGETATVTVTVAIPTGNTADRDLLHIETPGQLGNARGASFTVNGVQHYLVGDSPLTVGVSDETWLFSPELPVAEQLPTGDLTITYKPEVTFNQLVNIGEGSDIRFFDQTRLSSGVIGVQIEAGLAEQIIQPGGIAVVNPTVQYYNISQEPQLIRRGVPVNEFPADGISIPNQWSRVGSVAGGPIPFNSQTFTSRPFNFAYTLDQYNEVFNEQLGPINNEVNADGDTVAVPVTRTGVTLTLSQGETSFNASDNPDITTALNDYLNDAGRIGISQEEQIAIINGADRVQTRTVGPGVAGDREVIITFGSGLGGGADGFLSTQTAAVTVTRGGADVPATVALDPSASSATVTLNDGTNFLENDVVEVTLLGTGYGALVEMTTPEGSVTFYVRQAATSANWEWLQGGIPQNVSATVDLTINYYDRIIPTFNDVNRLPFAILDSADETNINNAIANGEALEFSIDNFITTSTVTSATINEDAFGRYYSLEFSSPLGGNFDYNPANNVTLSLRTADQDQRIESGSISGAVSQDGVPTFVPGALYRETGFDANDNHFDVQPMDFDGSHLNVKIVGKTGNGSFDQISVPIPELDNLNTRVAHLEQGGTGGGMTGGGTDNPSYTPRGFKVFPSPWIRTNGTLNQLWDNLRIGFSAGRGGNLTNITNVPASNVVRARMVADFGYRANGWRNEFGGRTRNFGYTIPAGATRISPGNDLFTALELAFLGEDTSDIYLARTNFHNNDFRVGFDNTRLENTRQDVTYMQSGTARSDLLMNFGTFDGGINHQITLGLTRVASNREVGASYYEIRNGALPQEIVLTSGTELYLGWLAQTPHEQSQLSGRRTETTFSHGTFDVGIDAIIRNPNFDLTQPESNQLRIYGLTQAQINQVAGTPAVFAPDGTIADPGSGWNAGGTGLEETPLDVRTLRLDAVFRQNESTTGPVNNSSTVLTYAVATNERTEGAAVQSGSTTVGGSTLRWLDITVPLTNYGANPAVDTLYANLDTVGFNPVTIREVWNSSGQGGNASAVDLHTLSSERVESLYPTPINSSWLETDYTSGAYNPPTAGEVLTATSSGLEFASPGGVPIVQLGNTALTVRPGQIARGVNDLQWFINTGTTDISATTASAEANGLVRFADREGGEAGLLNNNNEWTGTNTFQRLVSMAPQNDRDTRRNAFITVGQNNGVFSLDVSAALPNPAENQIHVRNSSSNVITGTTTFVTWDDISFNTNDGVTLDPDRFLLVYQADNNWGLFDIETYSGNFAEITFDEQPAAGAPSMTGTDFILYEVSRAEFNAWRDASNEITPETVLQINGGLLIETEGNGITFPDGTVQTTAATGASTEDLASRIDQFGTITSQVIPAITFGGTTGDINAVLTVTYNSINYYLVYTRSGAANTQYFYTAAETGTPFFTVQITT